MEAQTTETKIAFFRELVSCNDDIYSWCYDSAGGLLYTNAQPSQSEILHRIFVGSNIGKQLFAAWQEREMPLTLGMSMGLMWVVDRQETAHGQLFHLLGPMFQYEASMQELYRTLQEWEPHFGSRCGTAELTELFHSLPVVSHPNMCRYALMLHYCLTGEKKQFSDISNQTEAPACGQYPPAHHPRNLQRTYMAERALLHCVSEGDLNYHKAMNEAIALGNGGEQYTGSAMEQGRIAQIVFISLCARAAIEGGLSPDTAYALENTYIRRVQASRNITELGIVGNTMYEDFVQRVHLLRTMPQCSPEVQRCCEYVMMHVEEPLDLDTIAKYLNYTPYYFSRRFKREMHCSLADYIKASKIERAKVLLDTTELSILQIAERLHFGTRAHFSAVFTGIVGCAPGEYRRRSV